MAAGGVLNSAYCSQRRSQADDVVRSVRRHRTVRNARVRRQCQRQVAPRQQTTTAGNYTD